VEGQYYFTNPNTDKVGLSLLGAVESGDRSYSATAIFVAQQERLRPVDPGLQPGPQR
jgi:hypothetical protein